MISNRHARSLQQNDLIAISAIHLRAFPDSAITQLGNEAIKRYYEWLIIGPHPEACQMGLFTGKTLLGFYLGGRFNGAMTGFLQHNRSFLARRILTHPWLLFNPIFRERLKAGLLILKRLRKPLPAPISWEALAKPSFGILAIATHPDYQGQGVGRELMHIAEEYALEKGYRQMHLTVHPNNDQAIHFYEGLGWQRCYSEGRWRGIMEKRLASSD